MDLASHSLRSTIILTCAFLTCALHAGDVAIDIHQYLNEIDQEIRKEHNVSLSDIEITPEFLESLATAMNQEAGTAITPDQLVVALRERELIRNIHDLQQKNEKLQRQIPVLLAGTATVATAATASLVLASLYGNHPEEQRAEFRKKIGTGGLQILSTATYAFTNRNIDQHKQTFGETVLSQLIFSRLFAPYQEKLSKPKVVLLDIASDSILTISTKTLESRNSAPVLASAQKLYNDILSDMVTTITPTSVTAITEATRAAASTAGTAILSPIASAASFLYDNVVQPCNDNVISPLNEYLISPLNEYTVKPAIQLLTPDRRIQEFIDPHMEKQEQTLTKRDYALYVADSTIKYASPPIAQYVIKHTPALAEDKALIISGVTVITKHQFLTAVTKTATDTARYELQRHLSQNMRKDNDNETKQTHITTGDVVKLTAFNVGLPIARNLLYHLFLKYASPHLENKAETNKMAGYACAGIAATLAAPIFVTAAIKTATALGHAAVDAGAHLFSTT